MTPTGLLALAGTISLALLIAALLMTTLRVIRGPSLADRVLALDMLVSIAIGFIAVIAIRTGRDLYLDIAMALALVGFLATIAFARFIESQGSENPVQPDLPRNVRRTQPDAAGGKPKPASRPANHVKGGRRK